MPYYILTAKFGGPQVYQEHCYDEVVTVRDRMAVTQNPATCEQLQRSDGFTLLATVDTEQDVKKFLHPEVFDDEAAQISGPITKNSESSIKVKGRPKRELAATLLAADARISVPWYDNKTVFNPKVVK